MEQMPFNAQEAVIFALRRLYNQYGYSQYKMSKFEEYDLYAKNKDFLISDNVITFTDLSGKLMALKPDVTLSIVKNSKDTCGSIQKLYYNENVYRVTKGAHGFKEITQVGLECLGNIDNYCLCEVLTLAAESLRSISNQCILDISHLGLLSSVIDSIGISEDHRHALIKAIGEKNLHELTAVCRNSGISEEQISLLQQLVTTSGTPETVLATLQSLLSGKVDIAPLEQLAQIVSAIDDPDLRAMLRLDFSVVDDLHYYNGIVFKGYIHGIPSSVLSGGQYDKLMHKMQRKSGAVGFAVYMDMLERLEAPAKEFDVDTVLLYEAGTALTQIRALSQQLMADNRSVMVQQKLPEGIRYRQLLQICGNEVKVLENNA